MPQPLTAKELWCSMPGDVQVQGCFIKRELVPWLLWRVPFSTQHWLAKRQLTCMLMDMALLVLKHCPSSRVPDSALALTALPLAGPFKMLAA